MKMKQEYKNHLEIIIYLMNTCRKFTIHSNEVSNSLVMIGYILESDDGPPWGKMSYFSGGLR